MERIGSEQAWEKLPVIKYEKPVFLDLVDAYSKSGRQSMAAVELAIGEKNADPSGMLALGEWYLAQNDLPQAVKWGSRALKEKPSRRAYELAYQKPYGEYVLQAAAEFDMDPYLIWALMREESRYQKDAISKVGALGLMQIMPSTGKQIASKLKAVFNEDNLLQPEVNIRFGTYYLGSLLKSFSGDKDKAMAAYNGGSGNVKRWAKSKLGTKKEDFPTAISFLETREYVTKVMNSYYIYKHLYGE
jgi:soluble lytic murein transglycosylase